MNFYEELSKVYDIVFPVNQETVNFLSERVDASSNILDIARGTGGYVQSLGKLGHNVDGVDLDASMIRSGEKKVGNLKINFQNGDMREVNQIFTKKKYDLVYSIGNSIVHLESREEIKKLISDIHSMLIKDGEIILQIVNYERIKKYNITELPIIENKDKGVVFLRRYKQRNDIAKIEFETDLAVKDNLIVKHFYNRISLIPILGSELKDILLSEGFSEVELYGDFNNEEYSEESLYTVITGKK